MQNADFTTGSWWTATYLNFDLLEVADAYTADMGNYFVMTYSIKRNNLTPILSKSEHFCFCYPCTVVLKSLLTLDLF